LIVCEPGWDVVRYMTNSPDKIWITRTQFAERIDIPAKTAAEWATKGTGPRYARFGRHVRYRLADVIAWEEAQLTATG
jgi:hypothetical protein